MLTATVVKEPSLVLLKYLLVYNLLEFREIRFILFSFKPCIWHWIWSFDFHSGDGGFRMGF